MRQNRNHWALVGTCVALVPLGACDGTTSMMPGPDGAITDAMSPDTVTPDTMITDAAVTDARTADATLPDVSSVGCPVAGTTPIEHATNITADETWAAGLHLVRSNISVRAGATLTIAPCAVVEVRSTDGIDVVAGGTLVAEGTANQPILFQPEIAGGTWAQIGVYGPGNARFAYATLDGGGDVSSDPTSSVLYLRGDNNMAVLQPLVRVDHVSITHATKVGVRLDANASFTADSNALSISGATLIPLQTTPGGLGGLPAGAYTGNGTDEILVLSGSIQFDSTIHSLGVPYHMGQSAGASVRVTGVAIPLVTIEAGVTMRFDSGSDFEVEHFTSDSPATGALVAIGTSANPITFTSNAATRAPGDWVGIQFGGRPDVRNRLQNVVVEYAGGPSGAENHSCTNPRAPLSDANSNYAAILIFGVPSAPFITDCTIAHSAGNGIERGWNGSEIEIATGNTFTDVAWCQESFPRPSSGPCPTPVPCTPGS